MVVVGGLARYLRRKKRTIDPAKLRRNNFSGKRSRASGVRSPNGKKIDFFNFSLPSY